MSLHSYLDPSLVDFMAQIKYSNTHGKQQKQYKHAIALFFLLLFFPITMLLSVLFFIRITQVIGFMPNKNMNQKKKQQYSKELDTLAITISVFSLLSLFCLVLAREDFQNDTMVILLLLWIILSIIPVLIHLAKKYQTSSTIRNVMIVFLWLQFTFLIVGVVLFLFFFLLGKYIVQTYV
jgi:heme/copper-type cytochrome/quinol oxidase subunit 2